MRTAIDEEKLSTLQSLEIAKPPVKEIEFKEFPKMLYKHPKKDKSKEHQTRIVHSKAEEEAAKKNGWVNAPHVPTAPPEEEDPDFADEKGEEKDEKKNKS